ncbi:MAG TPA: toll/interleukin-1 receptor domain-containing protein, partial [Thermoanaerobaculia bacterium]|nr:toll/interleukin-1 receptor domain-containing protein [Thermoanaerobaculia bacterium]
MKTEGRIWRIWRRLRFRYDVFISYAHKDISYARGLRNLLRQVGFTCFLDEEEVQPGDKLRETLIKALDRTATLVVVGTATAKESSFVLLEVQYFASLPWSEDHILPINVDGAARDASWVTVPKREDEIVWIESNGGDSPTPSVIEQIERRFDFWKRQTVSRLETLAVAAVFAIVTIGSAIIINGQIERERVAKQDAQFEQALAELAKAQERKARAAAESAKAQAEKAQAAAESAQQIADERKISLDQEQGRLELLRGDRPRALVSLAGAYSARPKDDVIRYLVASAARGLETNIKASFPVGITDDAEISPDGTRVATLRRPPGLWDARGGAAATLQRSGKDAWLTLARFADSGRLLLTAGDKGLSVWRASDGAWLRDLRPFANTRVDDVAAPPDGRRVLVSTETDAYVVDVHTGAAKSLGPVAHCRRMIPCENSNLLLAPNARMCGVIGTDGAIRLFRLSDATALRSFDSAALASALHRQSSAVGVTASWAALSPDGSTLAVTSGPGDAIALFDTTSGAVLATLADTHKDSTNNVARSSGSLQLVFAGNMRLVVTAIGEILVWEDFDGER